MTALTKRVDGFVSAEKYCARQPISYRCPSISSNFLQEFSCWPKRMTVFCPAIISLACAASLPCTRTCCEKLLKVRLVMNAAANSDSGVSTTTTSATM